MRHFEVVANQPTMWQAMTAPARVVTQFLSPVRGAHGRELGQSMMDYYTVRDNPPGIWPGAGTVT